MEIVDIQKAKNVSINMGEAKIHISYIAKIRLKVKNKEIEIEENLWQDLPFQYSTDDGLRNLELIEHTMNILENKMNEIIEKIRKTFTNLEQILEKYGYQVL